MYNIEFTKQASDDIILIYEYIAFELLAPQNAANQIKRIKDAVYGLDTFPLRNPLFKNKLWSDKGLRYIAVDNYVVFYIPYEDNKTIKILRILYSKRNIDEIFG